MGQIKPEKMILLSYRFLFNCFPKEKIMTSTHYDLLMKKPSQKSVKNLLTCNYLNDYLILTFENAARDQITKTMWTFLLQVLRNDECKIPQLFFFCLKGTECIFVCTFVYAQDSVTHAPLYKSLFLSFFGLSNPNCLFLMADLLLGSVRVPHARYYILWTLERAGQECKTPCSQNVNCTEIPRWRQMLETNNENELLVPGEFFSTGAENIQLLPIIGQVFWILTF